MAKNDANPYRFGFKMKRCNIKDARVYKIRSSLEGRKDEIISSGPLPFLREMVPLTGGFMIKASEHNRIEFMTSQHKGGSKSRRKLISFRSHAAAGVRENFLTADPKKLPEADTIENSTGKVLTLRKGHLYFSLESKTPGFFDNVPNRCFTSLSQAEAYRARFGGVVCYMDTNPHHLSYQGPRRGPAIPPQKRGSPYITSEPFQEVK